ncbi:MAG: hypothetical protein V4692_05710 [Bdellovibrionota bacterium]
MPENKPENITEMPTARPKTIDDALEALDRALHSQRPADIGATMATGFDELKQQVKSNTQAGAKQAALKFDDISKELTENFGIVAKSLAASGAIAFENMSRMTDDGMAKAQVAVKDVDNQIRANPWPFIGGAAIGMLALGYFLGGRRETAQAPQASQSVELKDMGALNPEGVQL